jgi:hypothetical protein
MRIPQILAFAVALTCASVAHAEKTIYKCAGPNGSTVFSPTPCGKNAKEVDVSKTSSLSAAPSNDAIRDISDTVADTNCRDDARKLYVEPDTSVIARAEHDIRELQSQQWYSAGNPGQAQQMASDNGTRTIGLRNVIATEQARADAQRAESRKRMDEALKRCEEQKSAREEARVK